MLYNDEMMYEYSIHSNVDESKNITVITNVSTRQNIDKTNLTVQECILKC